MSVRFDAILFDAGGILLLPDPITIGTVIPSVGEMDQLKLIRSHYVSIAAINASTRHTEACPSKSSGDSYRAAYVQSQGFPTAAEVAAVKYVISSPHSYGGFHFSIPRPHCGDFAETVPIGVVSNASGRSNKRWPINACVKWVRVLVYRCSSSLIRV